MFQIERMVVRTAKMQLKAPFKSGVDMIHDKPFLVVEVHTTNGIIGYGEGLAFEKPYYTEETIGTMQHIIGDVLAPLVLHRSLKHPRDIHTLFEPIRRNQMAKSAVETAVWDAYAQLVDQPLAQLLGGTQQAIEVGVAIGLQQDENAMIARIQHALDEGYKRIKVKIKPGEDIELLRMIRRHFPTIDLMADANSTYTLEQLNRLKALDEFNLVMIEQPLAYDDLVEHAILQQHITTPICLDESICSLADAKRAVQLKSCKIINVKLARVGGFTEAIRIHDYCEQHDIGVWCGGMLEAGIGRAHAIAIASLPNFMYASDIAGANRYWYEDITIPEITASGAKISVPTVAGRGYGLNHEHLERITIGINTYV